MAKTIVGLKLSHDGAVAAIRDNRLLFSIEAEKGLDRPRYSEAPSLDWAQNILINERVDDDIQIVSVDGWKEGRIKRPVELPVNRYHEFGGEHEHHALTETWHKSHLFGLVYHVSFHHMTNHIVGSYACSPYAKAGQTAAVLSWDGGQEPRIHIIRPDTEPQRDSITYVGSLSYLYGYIYSIAGYYWGPMTNEKFEQKDRTGRYEWPGKLMAYMGKGNIHSILLSEIIRFHDRNFAIHSSLDTFLAYRPDSGAGLPEHALCKFIIKSVERIEKLTGREISDADVLVTLHTAIEKVLVHRVRKMLPPGMPLVFTGGSALNIKWNAALRECGHFLDVWVPPFPNDSGSAVGAAASANWLLNKKLALDWSVYCGPELIIDHFPPDLTPIGDPGTNDLAVALANGNIVLSLVGRSEIGPRALGARSLLASPADPRTKEELNRIKGREEWRPVAPVCLEEWAPQYFTPGAGDPYMLFENEADPITQSEAPAIVHLDGTSRLQTVGPDGLPYLRELLFKMNLLTGLPILCNTSANLAGSGFFSNTLSAVRWAREKGLKFIYINDQLYHIEA